MHKKTYAQKLLDPRWQQVRLQVFDRDKWTCRECGDRQKTLHAHHVQYHPLAEGPWDYDLASIITLCSECHKNEHECLETAKANLIIALTKKGFVNSYQFECLINEIEMDGKL